jgi:hypothetical protein
MRLRKSVEELTGSFDFIFLDCPPSLGLLTVNALSAADELIVPIQCEYYALEGLGQLLRNVRLVQQNLNQRLILSGIVLTMFDPRTRLSEQVVEEVRRFFGHRVYDAVIPRTVRLSEAPGFGLPVTHYAPRSKGAAAYRTLAREVLNRPVSGDPLPTGESPRVVVSSPTPAPAEEGEAGEANETGPPAERGAEAPAASEAGGAPESEGSGDGSANLAPEGSADGGVTSQADDLEDGEGDGSGGRWRLFRRKQGGET